MHDNHTHQRYNLLPIHKNTPFQLHALGETNLARASQYTRQPTLGYAMFSPPLHIDGHRLALFESRNEVLVNIYVWDAGVKRLRMGSDMGTCFHLLLYGAHVFHILRLGAFFSMQSTSRNHAQCCPRCMTPVGKLKKHLASCGVLQVVRLPSETTYMGFKSWECMHDQPVVVYADVECF